MSIIVHPLTMQDDTPTYSAQNYRQTVNPMIYPSDGTLYGSVQGVRYGAASPLCSISNQVVTVQPHSGVINPWYGNGVYSYTLTEATTLDLTSEVSGLFKICIIVNDPSEGYGSTPSGELTYYSSAMDDINIPGIVLGECQIREQSSVIEDSFVWLNPRTDILVNSSSQLNSLTGKTSASGMGTPVVEGQTAVDLSDNTRYTYLNGSWVEQHTVAPKQLWSGTWSSGSITVSGLNDYWLFECSISTTAQRIITFSGPTWTTFRGTGGGCSTYSGGYRADIYCQHHSRDGETLTYGYVMQIYGAPGGNASVADLAQPLTAIYGIA